MMEVMSAPTISLDERRARLAELVSVLGNCDTARARQQIDRPRTLSPLAVDLTDPDGFGGANDPWSDVALALVALRR
jgi:hypothetical protein